MEMLVGKGTGSLREPLEQGLGYFVRLAADQSGPAFVTSTLPQALLRQGACSRAAARAAPFGRPAERSYSESYSSSKFGSATVQSSILNTESLVCSVQWDSGVVS